MKIKEPSIWVQLPHTQALNCCALGLSGMSGAPDRFQRNTGFSFSYPSMHYCHPGQPLPVLVPVPPSPCRLRGQLSCGSASLMETVTLEDSQRPESLEQGLWAACAGQQLGGSGRALVPTVLRGGEGSSESLHGCCRGSRVIQSGMSATARQDKMPVMLGFRRLALQGHDLEAGQKTHVTTSEHG